MTVGSDALGNDTAEVAEAAAAIIAGITIEPLAPVPRGGYADAVVGARHRGEVARDQQRRTARAHAQVGYRADVGVGAIHPGEAVLAEVERMQRRSALVEMVQIPHPALHAGVKRMLQRVPFEAFHVMPVAALRELPA